VHLAEMQQSPDSNPVPSCPMAHSCQCLGLGFRLE
jgi:hypothetical protein